MSIIVSSFLPFPGICWWAIAADAGLLYLDGKEHFEKMTDRNRYYISGANGPIQLSIPLSQGRGQRAAMEQVQISYRQDWQVQHWRTLVSVYKRSPYFDHYEPILQPLFMQRYASLTDFNQATMQWLKKQMKVSFDEIYTEGYIKDHGENIIDLRGHKHSNEGNGEYNFPTYYQVFSERNGFLPNLSILDLLFSEGPYTMEWIGKNKEGIIQWMK